VDRYDTGALRLTHDRTLPQLTNRVVLILKKIHIPHPNKAAYIRWEGSNFNRSSAQGFTSFLNWAGVPLKTSRSTNPSIPDTVPRSVYCQKVQALPSGKVGVLLKL
jgi:hypothetical protein